jgi:hypothetical protein
MKYRHTVSKKKKKKMYNIENVNNGKKEKTVPVK